MSQALSIAPALLLGIAAAICLFPPSRERLRWTWASVTAVLLSLLLTLAQGAWLWSGDRPDLRITLSPWTSGLFTGGPALDVQLLAVVSAGLIGIAALLGLLRAIAGGADPYTLAGPLAIAASGMVFVAASRSPLGLVSSWLVMDLALFFGGGIGRRGLLTSQFGLLLVLAGLMNLPMNADLVAVARDGPSGPSPDDWLRFFLTAAGVVRMGVYPLTWSVPRADPARAWASAGARIAPTVAGASLVLLVADLRPYDALGGVLALGPGLVALVFGAVLAAVTSSPHRAQDWLTTYSGGLVVLAAGVGGSLGAGVALLLLIDLAIHRAVLASADDDGGTSRAARLLSAASLAGLPPTLGFVARWLLYGELIAVGLRWVAVIVAVATAVSILPAAGSLERGTRRGGLVPAGLTPLLTAALALILALQPGLRRPLLSRLFGEDLPSPWASPDPVLVALIALPLLAGYVGRLLRSRKTGIGPVRARTEQMLRLTDLFDMLRSALIGAGRVLHRGLGLVEGRRTMAWTLLAGVTVGLTLLASAGPAASEALPMSQGLLAWFMAALLVLALLLIPLPGVALVVVMGASLLSGLVLWSSAELQGVPAAEFVALPLAQDPSAIAVAALVKPLAGLVVVAILTISVLQAPGEGAGDPRHRLLKSIPRVGSESLLLGLALLIANFIIAGLRSTTLAVALPPEVLRPALCLIGGGVLVAVFARRPLRLAASVLVALIGFEMIYARIDPGLVVTGGLAAFQILLAILASLFVGPDAALGPTMVPVPGPEERPPASPGPKRKSKGRG